MKSTNFLSFLTLLCLISLIFTNCGQYYGPASTGNSAHYIARPWYNEEPASSLEISARLNKGHVFNANEKNLFGEAEINYARVFELGHLALGGGATVGQYKIVYPTHPQYNGYKSYHGSILRGEIGLHILPMLFNGFGGRRHNNHFESTTGIGYCWTTENGPYQQFRQTESDSISNIYSISHIAKNLHTLSFFNEYRQLLENEDIVGWRSTFGMTLETGLLDEISDFQYSATVFYTHKRLTFSGQVGGSLGFNNDNRLHPNLSFGVNARLWDGKKRE